MPQKNSAAFIIYTNYSEYKLGTRFCNQFTTTIPKNSVFSGISGVFLLLEFNDRYLVCTISSGLYYKGEKGFVRNTQNVCKSQYKNVQKTENKNVHFPV